MNLSGGGGGGSIVIEKQFACDWFVFWALVKSKSQDTGREREREREREQASIMESLWFSQMSLFLVTADQSGEGVESFFSLFL